MLGRPVACRSLADRMAAAGCGAATGVKRITIPKLNLVVEPIPGKLASTSIFNHLASKYNGRLDGQAVQEGEGR